ncbi:GerMN domain-containing protein [Streptomyces lividans]|uniref:Lipoprotein n=2 Tax=Streptomyces lividans TaxID=1916 RepID=A0ABN4DL03_STRLI|nr:MULTISPECIES: GerMN domain-containing protein [Streptomyces]QSJ06858.1 lipoprotein [Streptomyces lividans]WTC46500.1 GerMN domain-containing protein [Streptomyces anthocyanicus]AIJ11355.1 lipoprotein [Streptomyces lividans TK24]EFD64674.1 lipoprotein [Streptomyces lividans TK24]EOY52456.1 putative lipoprotein [Streptomyces lividans 1326]
MTSRHFPHPNRAALALAVLLAAGTAGCGIGTTGPVQAGAPASGVQRPGDEAGTVRLYFAGPYGTRPVTRRTDAPLAPQQALDLLLDGPTPAERERGLTTHVESRAAGRLTATTSEGAVDVVVPLRVSAGDLDVTAVSQLVCTAAHADVPGGRPAERVDVRIHESGTRAATPWALRCGAGGNATPVTG